MKRSLIQTLLTVLVLVGVVLWYFIYEKKVRPEQTANEEKAKQLTSLSQDSVQEINLQKIDGVIKLKKTGGNWFLEEPVADKADSAAVSSFLSGVLTAKSERTVEDKATDLDKYGLKTPPIVVTLKGTDGKETVIKVGADTPVGSSVYAMVSGTESVYKVPSSLKGAADKDVKALRNKALFEGKQDDVAEIEVTTPKGSYVLKRDNENKWQLARENLPADLGEARKVLTTITELRAVGFMQENGRDLSIFGLDKPAIKATVTFMQKDKPRHTILVGRKNGKSYVKYENKPVVYDVDKETADKLDRTNEDLRSTELANFSRFDVKRVKFEKGKESLEFFKEGSDWTLPLEPTTKVDSAKVEAFITKVQDTRIAKYTTEKAEALGLKQPQLTLRLFEKKDKAETEKVTLVFGAKKAKLVAGERKGLPNLFYIKEEDFQKLSLSKQDFLKVEVEPAKSEKTDKAEKKSE